MWIEDQSMSFEGNSYLILWQQGPKTKNNKVYFDWNWPADHEYDNT